MVKAVALILTIIQLLLIEGLDSNPADSKNGTATKSIRRILYGKKTDLSNFRFMVRIINKGTCTGAMVANSWVLTAAHCVIRSPCANIELHLEFWEPIEKIYPIQCYGHPEYTSTYHEHDIALLQLEQDFSSDTRVSALNLPPPGMDYPPGTRAIIAGWGRNERDESPGELLHAEMELGTRDHCTSQFTQYKSACKGEVTCGDYSLPRRLVCAVAVGLEPPGICYGDSGGPIIVDYSVIGIATILITHNSQCEVGAYSAFLRVVDYLPWIYSYIDPLKDTSAFPVQPEHPV